VTFGPVQLLVLGFDKPDFRGEVLAEFDRLRQSEVVRLIDAIAVHKDAEGDVTVLERTDLSDEEASEFGAVVGALLGLGAGGEEGAVAGATVGAEATAEDIEGMLGEEAWDVLEDIPKDSAAAILLLEHRWAIPLRDALARAGGFRIAESLVSPLDLVAVGLIAGEEGRDQAVA
jgi:uncharacterized membrane protein